LALVALARMRLERHRLTGLLGRAWELRHVLTPYDACYVALAERIGRPLVTTDPRLARSPGHRAEIRAPF
jgi:predicted nucleic acid-binding protein